MKKWIAGLLALAFAILAWIFIPRSPTSVAPESHSESSTRSENMDSEQAEPPFSTSTISDLEGSPDPSLPPQSLDVQNARISMKATLNSIYIAEKAYFAEYARYSTDLLHLGWTPEGNPLVMKAGFLRPFQPANLAPEEDSRRLNTDIFLNDRNALDQSGKRYEYDTQAKSVELNSLTKYCQAGCTASADSFELIAASNLDDDPTLDIWVINERKILTQISDDLKE